MYRDYTNIQSIYVTLVAQSCLTLWDSMDYSPPGSPGHGILQARILEGLPFPSPGESSRSRIEPVSPALQAVSLPLDQEGRPTLTISYCLTICFEMLSAFLFFLSFVVGWERNKSEIIYSLLSLSRDSDNFRAEKSLFSHSCKEFLQIQHILTPMYSKKRIQEKYSGQDA